VSRVSDDAHLREFGQGPHFSYCWKSIQLNLKVYYIYLFIYLSYLHKQNTSILWESQT